ncbi:unnamed protein product [Symbiodinium pilosum]|uniref:Uncharacterized protein n=1 Tax=Symbiodinium pilosum TaxID=2952 RepID=A0A812M6G6_SYMPI|nr:unnamed protein product [Symbiodinium pilosum]
MRPCVLFSLMAWICVHGVRDVVDEEAMRHRPSRHEDQHRQLQVEPGDSDGIDEDEEDDAEEPDREKDAFAGTAEDGVQIEGAVAEFSSATKDAENKAKQVDKNFADYNGRLGDLQDQLRKLSAMARSYHMQTIKWFKNAEQDKYSPIANMPLDTFKISKSKDDFPLESVS